MLTDKDGKKLQIGSIVSTCKPGKTNFTIKGKVVGMDSDHLVMLDFRTLFKRIIPYHKIKRIRYKGKNDGTNVDF